MKRLFIEAGHNNSDPGAIGNGYKEADLTKELRDLIIADLRKSGFTGTIVADLDNNSLAQTLQRFSSDKDDLILSLHFNAAGVASATGLEVIIDDTPEKKENEMAAEIARVCALELGIRNRGVKSELQTARKRIGILNIQGVALLLEVAFISNPDDMKAYQKRKMNMVKALSTILREYLLS